MSSTDPDNDDLFSQRLLRKMESSNVQGGVSKRRSASRLDELEASKRASYGRDIGDGISSIHRTKRGSFGSKGNRPSGGGEGGRSGTGRRSRSVGSRIPEPSSSLSPSADHNKNNNSNRNQHHSPPRTTTNNNNNSNNTTPVGLRRSLSNLEAEKLRDCGISSPSRPRPRRTSGGGGEQQQQNSSSSSKNNNNSAAALRRSLSNLEAEKLNSMRAAVASSTSAARAAAAAAAAASGCDPQQRRLSLEEGGTGNQRCRLRDLEATKMAQWEEEEQQQQQRKGEVGAQHIHPSDGRVRLVELELTAKSSNGGGGVVPPYYVSEMEEYYTKKASGGPGAKLRGDDDDNDEEEKQEEQQQQQQQDYHSEPPSSSSTTPTNTTTTANSSALSEPPPLDIDREMRLYSQMEGLYRQHQRYEEQRSFENSFLPSALDEMEAGLSSSRRLLGASNNSNNNNNPSILQAFVAHDGVGGGAGGSNGENVVEAIDVVEVESIKEEMEGVSLTWRHYTVGFAIVLSLLASVAVAAHYMISSGTAQRNQHHTSSSSSSSSSSLGPPVPSTRPSLAPTPIPTLAPTSNRRVEIFQKLQTVSSPWSLQTPDSPQQRAMEWIVEEDVLQREAHHPRLIQRYILAVFFFATQGQDWPCVAREHPLSQVRCGANAPQVTFLSALDECKWNGVECEMIPTLDDEETELNLVHVIQIRGELHSLYISGTLPSELGQLSQLRTLALPYNNITGTIPPQVISQTPHLEHLFLAHNQLLPPFPQEAFWNHPRLETVSVSHNRFGGTVPLSLTSIPTLKNVWLGSCDMTGTIPSELGTLNNLVQLKLDNNKLTGTIPSELSQFSRLQSLVLSHNRLNGTIPESFYTAWPNLDALGLENNALTGTVPNWSNLAWGRNNEKRKKIFLSDNHLSGTIPPSLALIQPLNTLELHGNNFRGRMPPEICAKTKVATNGDGAGGIFFVLQNLTADCAVSKSGPKVDCNCCSGCY